ncbi:MAG: molybdopterin molybdotransferase MoeA [Thaumarchaeota archaeon]|nr:molybdopterin molybdotransferase MoeA [Nitrososphaerota archaeon]
MKGFRELTSVREAMEKIRKTVTHRIGETEEVSLDSALGRVCGEPVKASRDSPEYDRSAVDGYAVVAEDTFGASVTNPAELKVLGRLEAGSAGSESFEVRRGEAVEIMTGAPIPRGANAVVPAESAKRVGDRVEVYQQVHPYQNVSRRGEDYRVGDIVLEKGVILKPWHLGALASLGLDKIKVLRKPKIAVLSTGAELVDPGEEISEGQVYNSTKPMLKSMLRELGAEPLDLGTAGDQVEEISEKISEGIREADAVIVTGGTSVGTRDLVPEAVSRIGEIVVHGLRIRPGKPAGFGVVNGKPVFMLSGFPVASLVGFRVLVVPALEHMMECRFDENPKVRGVLTRRITSPPGIRTFARVRIFTDEQGKIFVEPLRVTGSGILSTLTRGNGLLIIPEEVEGYDEGEIVEVELLSPIQSQKG